MKVISLEEENLQEMNNMKTYKQFNESIRSNMVGKSPEDIKKIKELDLNLNADTIEQFNKMGVNLWNGKHFDIDKIFNDIKKNPDNLSKEDIQKIFDEGFNADVYEDFYGMGVDLFKGKYLNVQEIYNDMKN